MFDTFSAADKVKLDHNSSLSSSSSQLEVVFKTLYDDLGTARGYKVFNDVPDALTRFSALGIKMGVLSNSDERVSRILEDVGLKHHFQFVLTSKEVGVQSCIFSPSLLNLRFLGLLSQKNEY